MPLLAVRERIANGLNLVVQQMRLPDGRRMWSWKPPGRQARVRAVVRSVESQSTLEQSNLEQSTMETRSP